MVFSSLIFVYAFLPLSLIFYVLAKNIKVKNAVLLIFSLLFYAWGEPTYVLILVFMTFSDWVSALLIEKSKSKSATRFHMTVAVIINIGLIGFFKYTGFALTNIQSIFGVPEVIPKIALPIGISFYTFQLLSYVIDVYRKEVPAQKNFFLLLLYSSLFYQCIAGPIVRYKDVNDEIEERSVDSALIGAGMIKEAVSGKEDEADDSFSFKTMLPLAVATSIDALAVGISFAFLGVDIVRAAALIGVTTFALSGVGVVVGNLFGAKYKSKAELAGGIVLILIGVKILLEHLGIISL